MEKTPLSAAERLRYSRHLLLPEIGREGQERLKGGSVLVVGAGGLGSPAALYLAAAGVGRIGLVDFDVVEESNLQRQVLYGTRSLGRAKLDGAADRITDLNPLVKLSLFPERLTRDNATTILGDFDVVLDGTDNFATRYLVNDACFLLGTPNVYGSIYRFEGQVSVFWAGKGPCYRCLHPSPPPPGLVPSCAEGGVLGVLPGVVGSLQATEAIKILLGVGTPLVGRFLHYDALGMTFRELALTRDPDCPLCGERPTITELADYEALCGVPAGAPEGFEIAPRELKSRLDRGQVFRLLDVREPWEAEICALEGALLVPLATLPERLAEIGPELPVVVLCRSGVRSARAVQFLRESGRPKAWNLAGGILAWARDVDPTLATY